MVSTPRWTPASRLHFREFGLVVVLVLLVGVMGALSPSFLHPYNLFDMTRHVTEIGIMACAMTLVIITGGIDLSVASALAMAGILMGLAWERWHLPLPLLILISIAVGTAGGVLNGLLITFVRIPPLIVTLGTWAGFRGVALAITRGQPFSDLPDSLLVIGLHDFFGMIPSQLLALVVVAIVSGLLLHRTTLGRYVYAIGNSETAARFAAVEVRRVKILVYGFSGFCAGLAAVILTARSFTARAEAAPGYELDVIACAVLGGTSIQGGRGSILGTMLGLAIIAVLRKGLGLAGVPGEWQTIFLGVVLIVTAIVNESLNRRRGRTQ
jgi:rhamnose transport system permease protein